MPSPKCFFAGLPDAGPCDGRLVKCHLIDRRLLRREFPYGAARLPEEVFGFGDANSYAPPGPWKKIDRSQIYQLAVLEHRPLQLIIDDPRCFVYGCGGPMGNAGHHGKLDWSKTLRVPRHLLPEGLEAFCAELGLSWWLDRTYGEAQGAVQ